MLRPVAAELQRRGLTTEDLSRDALNAGRRPVRPPRLLVVADAGVAAELGAFFPGVPVLHVGHGLISKNETARHYGQVDYICVASEAVIDRLTARGHIPRQRFLATGLIQTDRLFRRDAVPVRVPGCALTIAYAPTWNPTLGSGMMLGARLAERIRGARDDIGIIIKPHPHIAVSQPDLMDCFRSVAATARNVILYDEEADLVPVLLGADLLVSDASSAIFQYAALDRPIVLIDNPDRHFVPHSFDPDGIEWQCRDLAACVQDVDDLAGAVARELAQPGLRAPARRAMRTLLYGDLTDGRAALRVADQVQAILSPAAAQADRERKDAGTGDVAGRSGVRIYAKVVGDILHPGHVRFFAAAQALGAHLTVCVVGDERVEAYKGRPPLLRHSERMEVIAACRHVDAVIGNGPKIIDRAFMARNGFDLYAFGASDARERAAKLADCVDLPERMRREVPYTPGISSTGLRRRLSDG